MPPARSARLHYHKAVRTDEYDYGLPDELIAQTPAEPRDASRLMTLDRGTGAVRDLAFSDLPGLLRAGDVVVFNDSRVFPARLLGRRPPAGGRQGARVEVLLLERVAGRDWRALARPGRRLREGASFTVDGSGGLAATVTAVAPDGTRVVRLPEGLDLRGAGVVPMPPYVRAPLSDAERYQTVYSRAEGSVAAPTAGLHFTPGLLGRIRAAGAETAFATLHVGWDSFRPVTAADPRDHAMHSERYEISPGCAAAVNRARARGSRVVAVGTTTVRMLESGAAGEAPEEAFGRSGDDPGGPLTPGRASTDLFIGEGHRFGVVDAMVTNFHLPRSTLLMLVCAFAGRRRVLDAYTRAVSIGYRFYSLGDAMFMH